MTRRIAIAAALLVACGESKPKPDTTSLAAPPDTVKPAVVTIPDTVATKSTTKTSGTKGSATKTKSGVIVGRDSAIRMDPNRPRTIPPRPDTPVVIGRDRAIKMDPNRPRTIAPVRDTLR